MVSALHLFGMAASLIGRMYWLCRLKNNAKLRDGEIGSGEPLLVMVDAPIAVSLESQAASAARYACSEGLNGEPHIKTRYVGNARRLPQLRGTFVARLALITIRRIGRLAGSAA